jgi:superfamily II DNA or RNA helicase
VERELRETGARRVRALIAGALLEKAPAAEPLGKVTLHEHQRSAVARLRVLLDVHGGALLADEVGMGKSYVAAALAREACRPLVVAPAALLPAWRTVLAATGCAARLATYEALSRGTVPGSEPDLLVLDEAHHARNPRTVRWRHLATLARRARVLLLSATPIHNRRADLVAPFALFLGERARTLADPEMAALIVRRERADLRGLLPLPDAGTPVAVEIGDDEVVLDAILALPPPLPPRDGGDGGALLAWSLVRQWASSRAALAGALRRRLMRAAALTAALAEGRYPSRGELSAWSCADRAVQLAFPGLVTAHDAGDCSTLLAVVETHERAVRALLASLAAPPDPDDVRVARLVELRGRHAGERIVAFTQFADSAESLFRQLRAASGVALLTGRGARVAGGSLSRAELLERFAPSARGAREPPAAERIELLLATDLLSEGVDLRDASVVVHLDLPWTPARMEQRVGRTRRLGARHARTTVYAFRPPASAEALLGVERRLHAKLRDAARTVGIAGTILPAFARQATSDSGGGAPLRVVEDLRAIFERWRAHEPDADRERSADERVPAAAVSSSRDAALVLVGGGVRPTLLAVERGVAADDAASLLALAREAGGAPTALGDARAREAIAIAEEWIARRRARDDSGAALPIGRSRARQHVLRRVGRIAGRASRHRLAVLLPLLEGARRAASTPSGAGAEHVLARLADATMPDEAWLRAVATFGELHAPRSLPESGSEGERPRAILLLTAAR